MLNNRSSTLALLETRRSCKPRDMVEPGPDPNQLERLITIASRVPDHGQLAPWRFLEIRDRAAFAEVLAAAYVRDNPEASPSALNPIKSFASQAPTLVAVFSTPVTDTKIPLREQRQSAAAAAYGLLLAATAMGFVAGWITGWAAYSPSVLQMLDGKPGDEIVGFIFIGSPSFEIKERPRPTLQQIYRAWPSLG